MSQYIGKSISLISSKGIRYVGVLDDVNGEEATVTLKNVKPYGTEGRLNDSGAEIPPSNDVYPVVVFRGSDVHDLSVLDDPIPTSTGADASASSSAPQPQPQPQAQPKAHTQQKQVQESPVPEPQPQAIPHATQQSHQGHQQHRTHRQTHNNHQAFYQTKELPKNDFDFESSNAKFDSEIKQQDSSTQSQEPESKEDEEIPAYDKKKSFFDTISNSNDQTRPERTFNQGGYYNNNNGNNNRRGRGRGRGGRGRGRGGFRGSKPEWA